MARNRQRSKQRQAERRARRLQQQTTSPLPGRTRRHFPGITRRRRARRRARADPGPPGIDADHLEVGAPPEELGRSDFLLEHDEALVDRKEHEAALDDDEAARLAEEEEAYEEIEDWEIDDPDADAGRVGRARPATRCGVAGDARPPRRTRTARA